MEELAPLARSAPDKAEEQLKGVREFLASVAEKSENEAVGKQIEQMKRSFASLDRAIASGKKLAAMIGKEAAPLEVEAWVNGTPLTEITAEEEQAMLEKFAESHDLHHRFAIQKGSTLSEYYGVSGIPHVVVIDQEQKVRLMRVGSGEANAKAVGAMIQELLEKEVVGG